MATFNGYVIGGALNLRASCSTSSTRLTQIPNGTTINVSAVSGQNEWFQTSYGGYTGYVQSRYIAITNDGGTCTVTTSSGSLNVRVKPQSGATRIYTAAQYSTLRLLDYTSVSGWYRVSNSSGSGWAQSQFLTITAYPGGGGTGGGDGSGGDSGNGTWTYRIINHSDYVNIRETANGSIIGRLYPGDPLVYYAGVTYSAGGNDWYKIKFDGDTYIRASYVSLDTANHTIVDTFSYCPNKAVTYGYNHTDNTGSSTSCPNHNTEFGYIQHGDCANL